MNDVDLMFAQMLDRPKADAARRAPERPLSPSERAFLRTSLRPDERAKVRALAANSEFRYADVAKMTAGMPPFVAAAARAELERASYVPPTAAELVEEGIPAEDVLCGSSRALTLGTGSNREVMKTKDLDAGRAGITKMAETSAKASVAMVGAGVLAPELAAVGAKGLAAGAVKAAPYVSYGAEAAGHVFPDAKDDLDRLKLAADIVALGSGASSFSLAAGSKAHKALKVAKLGTDAVDVGLGVSSAMWADEGRATNKKVEEIRTPLGVGQKVLATAIKATSPVP